MSKPFTPHPHQKLAISHVQLHPRCAVWMPMGLGKSAATLSALEFLSLTEEIYPILIIAPLRVARSTWPNELKKWSDFSKLKISVITGGAIERTRALHTRADVYTINFENINWLITALEDKWPFEVIVVDEATKLKGFRLRQGAARARALSKVAFRSKRFIELTGSPASNGVKDLWGQLFFLDQGERLGKSFSAFSNRWFKQSYDGFSIEPLPHAQKEIEEKTKDLCLSIRAEDYFPTEDPIKITIPVKLPAHAYRQYKELEKKMFVDLGKHQIEALNAAAKTIKCLQFANGAIYVKDGSEKWEEVHDEKLSALESIIEEANGASILVAYNFKSDLTRLQRKFPHGKVLDKDPKTIKAWNDGKISLLFAHPASAGHGINLARGGNILVYFSCTWDLELHDQIGARLGAARQKQEGLNRSVFVYYIVAENTIDELVLERLRTKRSVQDILLEAMSRDRK